MCGAFFSLGDPAIAKLCSRCKVARFCSKQCQVESWPLHKLQCRVAQIAPTATVASPSSKASCSSVEKHDGFGKDREEKPASKEEAGNQAAAGSNNPLVVAVSRGDAMAQNKLARQGGEETTRGRWSGTRRRPSKDMLEHNIALVIYTAVEWE